MQEAIVLDTAAAKASTAEVLQSHSIPSIVSKDLADLLEKFADVVPVVDIVAAEVSVE